MNKIIKLVIIIVAFIVALSIIKNGLVHAAIESALSKAANVPVRIGSTNVQLATTTIDLKNIQIRNPRSFPEKMMVDAPEVYIEFDLPAIFKGVAHFREVRLNLKEVTVIKNSAGELNINALKPAEQKKKVQEQKAQGQAPKIKIDKLSLTIGRVVYKDYSQGGQPKIQTFDINIQDKQYENIDNIPAVVSLIMFEALTRTSLSKLANLNLSTFQDSAGDILSNGLGFAQDGADKVQKTAKDLLNIFK